MAHGKWCFLDDITKERYADWICNANCQQTTVILSDIVERHELSRLQFQRPSKNAAIKSTKSQLKTFFSESALTKTWMCCIGFRYYDHLALSEICGSCDQNAAATYERFHGLHISCYPHRVQSPAQWTVWVPYPVQGAKHSRESSFSAAAKPTSVSW